ncbi:MAG: DUF6152 family protein [Gammaproteobacteria bacterium]|nr:DUF6152 family protein [Gammaproteobacteria bacterium]MDH3509074.1 DUF6152 family protein [Gammaproteobacteria bacterium]
MSLLRKTDGHWGLQVAAVVVLAVSSWPAWSHHSHGNYLTTEYTNLQGTVREFHWMNPHTWIYLDVMGDDGQTTLWVLEGASPAELLRDGWARDDVNVGDNISVRCHQLRDRSNGCLLGFLTPEGGVEKEWD